MQCLQTTAQERRVTFRGLLFPLLGDEQIPRTLGDRRERARVAADRARRSDLGDRE